MHHVVEEHETCQEEKVDRPDARAESCVTDYEEPAFVEAVKRLAEQEDGSLAARLKAEEDWFMFSLGLTLQEEAAFEVAMEDRYKQEQGDMLDTLNGVVTFLQKAI